MKIFIISPYDAMLESIKNSISHFTDISIEYGVGDLTDGVKLALKVEKKGFDAIISRGGTAQMIQEHVSIPVIDMGLSGYDILKTIIIANNQREKTALIGFSNITSGAHAILDLLDLSTAIYTIESEDDVHSLLIQLKEKGFNYIIGDVITTKKATDLNLNSLLLQSGEETIKTAIKQAYFILKHLSHEDHTNTLITKGFRLLHGNYLLLNNGSIIESNLEDFKENPLNQEQLYTILNDNESNKEINTVSFKDLEITVDVLSYNHMNEDYKLLLIKPLEEKELHVPGISNYALDSSYKLVTHSEAMKRTIDQVSLLIKRKKIIHLIGKDSFTENTLINFMRENINEQGKVVELDLDLIDLDNLFKLEWTTISVIVLKNIKNNTRLDSLIDVAEKNNVSIIITETPTKIEDNILNDNKIIPIYLPSLNERIEDTFETVTYLISYYHNHLGTKAIKIKDDTNKFILEHYSFETMDEYISVIKEVVFKEVNYTISLETIQNIITNRVESDNILFTNTEKTLEEMEAEYINKVVEEEDFNQTKSAKRLGISRATLWRKLKKNNS